jgi:hypothetical protein
MPNYKQMYFILFNAVVNAIDQLENAQQKSEDIYIESDDIPLIFLPEMAKEVQDIEQGFID